MARAYGVICDTCDARLTVMESSGRVGVSPSATPEHGPIDDDATWPRVLELPPGDWPSCPHCGAATLRRDPNSTDVTFPDDPPPVPPLTPR